MISSITFDTKDTHTMLAHAQKA